jgi:hypothetical protein
MVMPFDPSQRCGATTRAGWASFSHVRERAITARTKAYPIVENAINLFGDWPKHRQESRVDFQVPGDPNTVRLPATALMPANRGTQVAILDGDGKVALKGDPARTGLWRYRRGDCRSISAGPGDR